MSREKLKEHYAEIIRNQLKMQNPEGKVSIYHKLLENEYEEDSAVDVLAFYMAVSYTHLDVYKRQPLHGAIY